MSLLLGLAAPGNSGEAEACEKDSDCGEAGFCFKGFCISVPAIGKPNGKPKNIIT